jgi:nucleoside-specific outer membrane channel protein Tsx
MMNRTLLSVLLCSATTLSFAGDILQWQDNRITGLYGSGFEVDPETQETLTLEHADGWAWGDNYAFVDLIYYNGDENSAGDKSSYYGEISPRLSAGKILKKDLSVAFVKDWLLAGCWEFGRDVAGEDFGYQAYLIGAGVDLDVPFFDYLQLNVYERFPKDGDGQTVQITPAWRFTIPAGKSSFVCDGFIDWVVNSDGAYEKNLHICPQFKFDVGVFVGMEANHLLAGVEYDYWKNKYGIQDSAVFKTDQNAISGIVQYHF